MSSAYASIFQVVIDLKQDAKSVGDDRHSKAKHLQTALDQVIPTNDHKLKTVGKNLAKLYTAKVCLYARNLKTLGDLIIISPGGEVV